MAFALVYSRALVGVAAPLVQVEVHLANGLPQFNLVGLPDAQVRESRERVRAALANCGFKFPSRRITVNLAPADLPKQSSRFDLPIALGILAASGQIADQHLGNYEFAGELALSGELRPVQGALPMAVAVGKNGRQFVLPAASAPEGVLAGQTSILSARHLLEVCQHLTGARQLPVQHPAVAVAGPEYPDMADVRGQQHIKRALEIAAAGGHHLLMVGPPGTGKSMLAARFPGICPPLSDDEALEVATLQASSQDRFSVDQWRRRPFRHPHHSVTAAAMTGGGPHARPGEVSLAHCGTLHLDEMAEFARSVLEMLREPMETGAITISRAARKLNYPARFQLVGAMNPCPCGYRGHPSGRCQCTPEQVARYARRISGPLLDRIDLQLEVPALSPGELQEGPAGESSSQIRVRVMQAVDRQLQRQGRCNAMLAGDALTRHVALDDAVQRFLLQAAQQFQLSARAMHRVLRVARTVADMEGRDQVDRTALGEAFCYRGSLYNPW